MAKFDDFGFDGREERLLHDTPALLLLRAALRELGIPSYGMDQYEQVLKDAGLRDVDQLLVLDANDWKRLNFPVSVQTALRRQLAAYCKIASRNEV